MKPEPKKENPVNPHSTYRSNRTGEDIDMLNETKQSNDNYDSNSTSYKDDIDGA